MKIRLELTEFEEVARNKILHDIGKIIDKDLIGGFIDNTGKCIKASFGSLYIIEEVIALNISPECFIDIADYIDKHIKPAFAGLEYAKYMTSLILESIKLFNKKWEVTNNENTNTNNSN